MVLVTCGFAVRGFDYQNKGKTTNQKEVKIPSFSPIKTYNENFGIRGFQNPHEFNHRVFSFERNPIKEDKSLKN